MKMLDDRLRRALHDAEPPGDPSGVVDLVLRKAARRHARRSVGVVVLTISVIAGSLGGFYALTRVFGGSERGVVGSAAVTNGVIAYVSHVVEPTPESGDGSVTEHRSVIWTMEADGGTPTRLIEVSGLIMELEWSPDGRRLAFGDGAAIMILDVGSYNFRVVDIGHRSAYGLSWSPDGAKLLATDDRSGPDVLYSVDVESGGVSDIHEAEELGWTDWSLDGERIVFVGPGPDPKGQGWDIYAMDPDGSNVVNLTKTETVDLDPSWSPDGTKILFRSRRDGVLPQGQLGDPYDEIYVMDADGTDPTRLTFDESRDQWPVWSPDGAFIAYTSQCCDEEAAVVVMNADGSDPRRLPVRALSLAWQPIPGDPDGQPTPTPELTTSPDPTGSLEPTPHPTPPPFPSGNVDAPVTLAGVPFVVCDVDALTWLSGPDGHGQAFTFEEPVSGLCDSTVEGPQYLAVTTEPGEGISRADTYVGPLDRCVEPTGCRVYATTELDGDPPDEILVLSNGGPEGIEVWFFDVAAHGDGFTVRPFEAVCPASADCDPMVIRTIDWQTPGLSGLSCGRYALDGSYSYSPGDDFYEWTSETGDGWTAERWTFAGGRAEVDPLREVASHRDPREVFAPSDDGEICLEPAAVPPFVLAD